MNEENKFTEYLKTRLEQPLPGFEAHLGMAPKVGGEPYRGFKPEGRINNSAVLIMLFEENGHLNIIFTLRGKGLNSHSGQISFPGGHSEDGETPEDTALREAREEIALDDPNIEIIGRLSPLWVPPSSSNITPVVAYLPYRPEFRVNSEDEVEEVFTTGIEEFIGGTHYKLEIWNFNGRDVEVPFWDIHPTTPLWGATSMILNELLELYGEYRS